MSANEEDELCDLFENLMDLRKTKTDFLKLDFIQALEDEEEEKTLTTSLPEIISGMYSADLTRILTATQSLRRMLRKQSNPPIEKIIESGLVTLLVTFLGCDGEPLLQFEAAWALINIASGTSQQTHAVVQAGAVPQLIRLLASPHVGIVHNCVWALGNIIGDRAEFRDFVIESGILPPLMRLVDMNAPPNFLGTVTWVILNLCRKKNHPPKLENIRVCLLALRMLIRHTDYEVLRHACWALYHGIDSNRELIQQVVEPGLLSRLAELLGNPEPCVITAALLTIGKILTVDKSQMQTVIDCSLLQMLPPLLQHPKVSIKKLACWVLSKVTCGSSEQIQAVINCNLLPLVVEVLNTGDFKSQYQATWVIIGLTGRGTLEQIIYLVQCGTFKSLCDLLTTKEEALLSVVLNCIFGVLKATSKFGQVEPLCILLKEIGGLDKIEKLHNHENCGVKYMSNNIIHTFFSHWVEDRLLALENIDIAD
ncbi:hypothetical protein BsWGS_20328 [Bradybaena similaris]